MNLSDQQVVALAPDPASVGNGRKLAAPGHWQGLGRSAEALWGECKGSAVYQVQVATADLASKCSCPSRKFPCKHALALMFLAARPDGPLAEAAPPAWVADWLARRTGAAKARGEAGSKGASGGMEGRDGSQTRATAVAQAPDPAKQAARAAKREARVDEGVAALEAWLADLARGGLAGAEHRPAAFWEEAAARLVDAQAPGLAARVRRLAAIPHEGAGWPARLLGGLGRTALLTTAWRRLDALDPALREDVRALVGFTTPEAEVLASGARVADDWVVTARALDAEPHGKATLWARRTWLRGRATGRWALLLDFDVRAGAGGGRLQPSLAFAGTSPVLGVGFGPAPLPGVAVDGALALYPGAWPCRAVVTPEAAPRPAAGDPPGAGAIATLLADVAGALARQPWLDRFPALIAEARVALGEGDAWWLVDAAGDALPLRGAGRWRLLAATGGAPATLAGEWDGEAFRPLTAWVDGQAVVLEGEG